MFVCKSDWVANMGHMDVHRDDEENRPGRLYILKIKLCLMKNYYFAQIQAPLINFSFVSFNTIK